MFAVAVVFDVGAVVVARGGVVVGAVAGRVGVEVLAVAVVGLMMMFGRRARSRSLSGMRAWSWSRSLKGGLPRPRVWSRSWWRSRSWSLSRGGSR